jgi:hypothetical protein
MVNLSLEPGEKLIISSRAQFCDLKRFSQFKTGNSFLTDRRFVFMGRLQIKTWIHLFAVVTGKGKRQVEIRASSLKKVKKKRLENTLEIVYMKKSKEEKALLRAERIPYLGAVIGVGLGVVGEEIGQLVGESVSGTIGELVGEKTGGFVGQKAGELTGETIKEVQAKNLTDAWLKAFHYVMGQYPTEGHSKFIAGGEPGPATAAPKVDNLILKDSSTYDKRLPEVTMGKMKNPLPVTVGSSHKLEIISLWQIFEEELGKDFSDFEIPLSQIEYFGELVDRIEGARNYREREIFSSQMRAYLRHLKQLRKTEAQI